MTHNMDEDKIKLRSEEVQEILTTPPSWMVRWGITLVFLVMLIVLAFTFIIKYPDTISANVILTTETPTEQIIARTSGALDDIFIQNGNQINENQNLAVIRNTAKTVDVFLLKEMLDKFTYEFGDFDFPIEKSNKLILGDIESSYINFEKDYKNFLLVKSLQPYKGQIRLNKNSIKEEKNRLLEVIKQKNLLKEELDLKNVDFKRYKILYDKGVISLQEFEKKRLEIIQIEKSVNSVGINISQIRQSIASAGQNLTSSNIDKKEQESQFAINLSQSLNILKKSIIEWEHNYLLKSSISGKVSFQEFWGQNQFVNSGEIIFTILPDDKVLVGKLTVPSTNSGKISNGQKVNVKLDNFPSQQFGYIIGRVQNISISPNKNGNYFVYIDLPEGTLTSYNINLPFDQELIGVADIITKDLSVADRIFYKFKELFQNW